MNYSYRYKYEDSNKDKNRTSVENKSEGELKTKKGGSCDKKQCGVEIKDVRKD